MIELIRIDNPKWEEIVSSFPHHDIYFRSGYMRGFQIHGDGEPILMFYSNGGLRAVSAFHHRAIPESNFCDLITPYGYGGFIFDGDISEQSLKNFAAQFQNFAHNHKIVSAFIRLHPLIKNAEILRSIFPVIDLGETIDIALTHEKTMLESFSSQNRNKIRKAQKNGVKISHGTGMELFDQFLPLYHHTMDRDNASSYYYFDRSFYESIDCDLSDSYRIFYAHIDDRVIAAAVILIENRLMHYHLSGSLSDYRHLAPTNLLLFEAARWGADQGYERFHLGGGLGSQEDPLFAFKKGFNKHTSNRFSICKLIFDPDAYQELVDARIASSPTFDDRSTYFPLYRA